MKLISTMKSLKYSSQTMRKSNPVTYKTVNIPQPSVMILNDLIKYIRLNKGQIQLEIR